MRVKNDKVKNPTATYGTRVGDRIFFVRAIEYVEKYPQKSMICEGTVASVYPGFVTVNLDNEQKNPHVAWPKDYHTTYADATVSIELILNKKRKDIANENQRRATVFDKLTEKIRTQIYASSRERLSSQRDDNEHNA